jgi:hypothetical protein
VAVVNHIYKGRAKPASEEAVRKAKLESDRRFVEEKTRAAEVQRNLREVDLARRRRELISRDMAQRQASFLLVIFRERLLARARKLPRKLVGKSAHEMKLILHEDACEYLNELEQLPDVLTREQFEE